jgi:hypothetical protein
MQYLESAPPHALAAFRAGHALYFNPPPATQARLLLPLCAQLGMGAFGATADGGLGGDVELFAVRGRHATPWHWDAQENFTVQCRGTKRWRLARGPLPDPLTNFHPASSNRAALAADARTHRACMCACVHVRSAPRRTIGARACSTCQAKPSQAKLNVEQGPSLN